MGIETVRDVLGKKNSQKTDEYVTAFAIQFFGLLLFLPIVLWVGVPQVQPVFWWALLGGAITVPLGNILYMRAVKVSDISLVVPMLAFNPFFTALVSYFMEGRVPNTLGWLGVILVGVGLYSLRLNKKTLHQGWLTPLLQIKKEPGTLAMLGVAVVWSVGANIGKVLVMSSGSPVFSTFVGMVVGVVMLFLIIMLRTKFQLSVLVSAIKNNFQSFGILGGAVGLSNLAMSAALSTGFTPYVISIKRSNMIFSSIAGKFFFGEKLTKNKILGILVMFAGLVAIVFS